MNDSCAVQLVDTVPLVMAALRAEMRRGGAADLPVPQFRTLAYVRRHKGTSLSDVAEHVGLLLPSMSKMVDGLVKRGLLLREFSTDDRRRLVLNLTRSGSATLEAARRATIAAVSKKLAALSRAERQALETSLARLNEIFSVANEGAPLVTPRNSRRDASATENSRRDASATKGSGRQGNGHS